MPILEIEVVEKPGAPIQSGLSQELADAAGEVLDTEANRTWVRLRTLPTDHYAENGGKDPDVWPVFVRLTKAQIPESPELEEEGLALTKAIAQCCGRPEENVHLRYGAPAKGRQFFGGKLME